MSEQLSQTPEKSKEAEYATLFRELIDRYAVDVEHDDEDGISKRSFYEISNDSKYEKLMVSTFREQGEEGVRSELALAAPGSESSLDLYFTIRSEGNLEGQDNPFEDSDIFNEEDGENNLKSIIIAESIIKDLVAAEQEGRLHKRE